MKGSYLGRFISDKNGSAFHCSFSSSLPISPSHSSSLSISPSFLLSLHFHLIPPLSISLSFPCLLSSTLPPYFLLLSLSALSLSCHHTFPSSFPILPHSFTPHISPHTPSPGHADPVQHFYFSLSPETGTISWSREPSRSGAKEGRVLEVHEGPSPSVQHSPAYSPADLHKHVFWVLTDRGVLNLFAYNEDAYVTWVRELDRLAQNCPVAVREQLHCSRPSSACSEISRNVTSDAARPEQEQCSLSGDVSRSSSFFLSAFDKTSTPACAGQSSPGATAVNFEPSSSLPFLDDLI